MRLARWITNHGFRPHFVCESVRTGKHTDSVGLPVGKYGSWEGFCFVGGGRTRPIEKLVFPPRAESVTLVQDYMAKRTG